MGFASGSVSLRRFAVVGESPEMVDEALLEKLAEHALRSNRDSTPEEVEYGWSGGRHILDGAFSFENNVYADALHFALRIDTRQCFADPLFFFSDLFQSRHSVPRGKTELDQNWPITSAFSTNVGTMQYWSALAFGSQLSRNNRL